MIIVHQKPGETVALSLAPLREIIRHQVTRPAVDHLHNPDMVGKLAHRGDVYPPVVGK